MTKLRVKAKGGSLDKRKGNNFKIVKHSWQIARKSRNSFVDLQSKKTVKRQTKKFDFSLKADLLYFD